MLNPRLLFWCYIEACFSLAGIPRWQQKCGLVGGGAATWYNHLRAKNAAYLNREKSEKWRTHPAPLSLLPPALLQLLLIGRLMAFTEIGLVTKWGLKPGPDWVPAWEGQDFERGQAWKFLQILFPGQQVCPQLRLAFHFVSIDEWVKILGRVGAFEWEADGIGDSLVSQGQPQLPLQGQLGRGQECQCLQGGTRVSVSRGRVARWQSRCGCSADQEDQPGIQSEIFFPNLTNMSNEGENEPRPTVLETVIEVEAAKGNSETCLGFEEQIMIVFCLIFCESV